MTDTTQVPAGADAPTDGGEGVGNLSDFDTNLSELMGYSLSGQASEEEQASETDASGDETPAGGAGDSPPTSAQPIPAASDGANGAPTPATATPAAGGEDQADPNLILAMMGAAPAPAAAPVATPAPANDAPATAAPADDEPYMPVDLATFRLPPGTAEALFSNEDPASQERALATLVGSVLNGALALADKRMREFHAPRIEQRVQTQTSVRTEVEKMQNDFFGTYPELKAHPQVVARAFEAYGKVNPGVRYSEEVRGKVGTLARHALRQAGVVLAAPTGTAPAKPVGNKPAAAPKKAPYVAGGARPAGTGAPADPTSPGALLDEMTGWGG